MRTSYNLSNVNIEEKEINYKPDNLIMVSRCHKEISCLKCGKKFHSEGPYNRICNKCNLINERTRANTYSVKFEICKDNVLF
ncbi:DNA repair exonuclease [Candidatus Scalindua japonica]|uniref:DNA repair exonuclease n=1 Tax=Candidatus Scalindua japonica TaxID=1284222 RepID=A0A286TW66_9BACT|nr:hypothetical protein [Candidatus Scalindua japonica]GAX60094.1 DNA repair exonuclease [Candidatus Scalindua japonica]